MRDDTRRSSSERLSHGCSNWIPRRELRGGGNQALLLRALETLRAKHVVAFVVHAPVAIEVIVGNMERPMG